MDTITTLLTSCVAISGKGWIVKKPGIQFKGIEKDYQSAHFKAILNAAKIYCYEQAKGTIISLLNETGDVIQCYNERALTLIGMTREEAKSRLYQSRDFWKNYTDYEIYRKDLIQRGSATAKIELMSLEGFFLGEIAIEAKIISPHFPLFTSQII